MRLERRLQERDADTRAFVKQLAGAREAAERSAREAKSAQAALARLRNAHVVHLSVLTHVLHSILTPAAIYRLDLRHEPLVKAPASSSA